MIWELVKEALYTLRTNPLRTILTMIGIILGVGAVVSIMTMGRSAYSTAEKSIQDSGYGSIQITHNYGGSSAEVIPLDQSFLSLLRSAQIEGVTGFEPRAGSFGAMGYNGNDDAIMMYARYSNVAEVNDLKYLDGGAFDEVDVEGKSQVIVIDEVIAKKLFESSEAAIGERIRTDAGAFYKVVGVTVNDNPFQGDDQDYGYAWVPMSVVELEPFFQTYGYDLIAVSVEMGADYDELGKQLETFLMESYGFEEAEEMSMSVENVNQMMAEVSMFMTAFSIGLSLIAAISLVVGGVGIMNIMLVSVTERTKEIGLMKALGARDNDIVFQFLVEAMVMTVWGGILGVGLGGGLSWLVIWAANTFGQDFLPEFTFAVDMSAVWVSLGVSLVIGLVFGAYPARRAAKLDPVEALRRD